MHAFAEQPRGFQHQIIGGVPAGLRQGTGHFEMQFGPWRQGKTVSAISERDQAFELVITVETASNHTKRQVDLGVPVLDERWFGGYGIRLRISSIGHGQRQNPVIATKRAGRSLLLASELATPSQ